MLFDNNRTYKFRHIQSAGLVRDRVNLKEKVEKFGFPPGRLSTPRDRGWTGKELNDYYYSLPTTQEEFAAAMPNHTPSKPDIPKKPKAARRIITDDNSLKHGRRDLDVVPTRPAKDHKPKSRKRKAA